MSLTRWRWGGVRGGGQGESIQVETEMEGGGRTGGVGGGGKGGRRTDREGSEGGGEGGGGEEVQVEGKKGVLLQVTFTIFIHHFLENTNIRMEIGEREKKRRTGEEGKGKRRERRVENE